MMRFIVLTVVTNKMMHLMRGGIVGELLDVAVPLDHLTLARLPPFMTSGKPQSASQLALAHLDDATVMTHCVIVTCCYQYISVGVDASVLAGGLAHPH